MKRDPRLYLDDILEAIAAIAEYTEGVNQEAFLRNRLLQDAVVRRIEIIGEAANQLPQETKDQAPGVPWADIVGMRHRVIHGYFGVRLDRVWEVVERDVPALKPMLEELQRRLG